MFNWFKKEKSEDPKAGGKGPDFSNIDSLQKAVDAYIKESCQKSI